MNASTRRRLRSVAAATGVGLLAMAFAVVFVVERLLYGLHVGAKACRALLADRLPNRAAPPTDSSSPTVEPDELDDGLRPLSPVEEPVSELRQEAA